jgi:hypothetical protein
MAIPFSEADVHSVADAVGVDSAALREAASSVQSTLGDYPGRTVDGLVYEWRQAFRHDPLVERTPDAWVLRVPERVWADVRERAGVDDAVVHALLALHERRAEDADSDREDGVVLVLARD